MELEVKRMKADVEIDCHEPAHFFRGLNWVLNHLEKAEGESEKKEKAYFAGNGLMLDCSRNAVFTVEKVKAMIRILAKLGLNRLLLIQKTRMKCRSFRILAFTEEDTAEKKSERSMNMRRYLG